MIHSVLLCCQSRFVGRGGIEVLALDHLSDHVRQRHDRGRDYGSHRDSGSPS